MASGVSVTRGTESGTEPVLQSSEAQKTTSPRVGASKLKRSIIILSAVFSIALVLLVVFFVLEKREERGKEKGEKAAKELKERFDQGDSNIKRGDIDKAESEAHLLDRAAYVFRNVSLALVFLALVSGASVLGVRYGPKAVGFLIQKAKGVRNNLGTSPEGLSVSKHPIEAAPFSDSELERQTCLPPSLEKDYSEQPAESREQPQQICGVLLKDGRDLFKNICGDSASLLPDPPSTNVSPTLRPKDEDVSNRESKSRNGAEARQEGSQQAEDEMAAITEAARKSAKSAQNTETKNSGFYRGGRPPGEKSLEKRREARTGFLEKMKQQRDSKLSR